MTLLLDSPSQNTAELSVVPRNFDDKEEANTMTATAAGYGGAGYKATARRVRPHGLDRVIMRVSLMMLLWARRHADRTAVSHEEHTRMYRELQRFERRERDAALLIARVR